VTCRACNGTGRLTVRGETATGIAETVTAPCPCRAREGEAKVPWGEEEQLDSDRAMWEAEDAAAVARAETLSAPPPPAPEPTLITAPFGPAVATHPEPLVSHVQRREVSAPGPGMRARLGRTSRYVPECETCRSGVTRCPEHGLVRYDAEPVSAPYTLPPAPAAEVPPKPMCVLCGQTETARGGDVHCQGDCDDASHGEPDGCHPYLAPGTEFRPYGYTAPHAHPETRASVPPAPGRWDNLARRLSDSPIGEPARDPTVQVGVEGVSTMCPDPAAAVREKLAREKAPAAEAKGEMTEPEVESHLTTLRDCELPYETATRMVTDLFRHDASLRTRAREAEERAERLQSLLDTNRVPCLRCGKDTAKARDARCYQCRQEFAEAFNLADRLTRERDEAREQRDAADARLPKEMPGCTILFKSCPLGHGRLVGANWIDTGCPWCLLAAATPRAEERKEASKLAVEAGECDGE